MADVFISYAKADRDKVVMLAAYLESEGLRVWWDNNLTAGDAYRDEIATELTAARAVIVLWTQTSVKSDFVRAEAGRAKADSKLIPVKDGDVSYGEIPLPFGEMHTEHIANRGLIRAAVVGQLAKPTQQPSTLHVATKTLRYQVLTWMGIVGGSVTLFTNLGGILNLADWARWLVDHWHEWTRAFWQWSLSFIHIKVPPYWTGVLSFLVFGSMIAVSQRMLADKARKTVSNVLAPDGPALPLLSIKTAIAAAVIVLMPLGLWLALEPMLEAFGALEPILDDESTWGILLIVPVILLLVLYLFSPQIMLVVASKHRLKATCVVALSTVFFCIIAIPAMIASQVDTPVFSFAFFIIGAGVTAAMLILAPINSLSKRLSFLAIGVILLVTLNVLSRYAVDIREWLKPPASSQGDPNHS